MPGFGVNTEPRTLCFCLPAHRWPYEGVWHPSFLEKAELEAQQEAWQSRTQDTEHMSHGQALCRGPDPESSTPSVARSSLLKKVPHDASLGDREGRVKAGGSGSTGGS